MKNNFMLVTLFVCGFGTSAFASGFSDCFTTAHQYLAGQDAVTACAGAGQGFSACFETAHQYLAGQDAVKACTGANADFADCFATAHQYMAGQDAVKACGVRTCGN